MAQDANTIISTKVAIVVTTVDTFIIFLCVCLITDLDVLRFRPYGLISVIFATVLNQRLDLRPALLFLLLHDHALREIYGILHKG
jgi:hypothetical protein